MTERLGDLEKEFIEKLAALEHEQWMTWARSIKDTEKISKTRIGRWETYFVPYEQLTEPQKEYDRIWARKVFDLMRKHVDD